MIRETDEQRLNREQLSLLKGIRFGVYMVFSLFSAAAIGRHLNLVPWWVTGLAVAVWAAGTSEIYRPGWLAEAMKGGSK